jgi:hypothetical protein
MSEPERGGPDVRLLGAVDGVLAAARGWRAGRDRWTAADAALEYRIWLELRDLQDCRDRPDGTDDLPAAVSRLLAVSPPAAAFPPAAAELGAAIDTLGLPRDLS